MFPCRSSSWPNDLAASGLSLFLRRISTLPAAPFWGERIFSNTKRALILPGEKARGESSPALAALSVSGARMRCCRQGGPGLKKGSDRVWFAPAAKSRRSSRETKKAAAEKCPANCSTAAAVASARMSSPVRRIVFDKGDLAAGCPYDRLKASTGLLGKMAVTVSESSAAMADAVLTWPVFVAIN